MYVCKNCIWGKKKCPSRPVYTHIVECYTLSPSPPPLLFPSLSTDRGSAVNRDVSVIQRYPKRGSTVIFNICDRLREKVPLGTKI